MKVVKKLNNNVVVCLDNNGEELVAFGKGIGFPKVPYELTDMNQITMTFYKLDMHYFQLLKDIPSAIFDLSAEIVAQAQKTIPKMLNPNLVFTLADHINFALQRLKDYQAIQLPFSYDIEHLYPLETKVGYDAVDLINQQFHVCFSPAEATAIAMHLVNSQVKENTALGTPLDDEILIEKAVQIIEQEFDIKLNTKEFTYNRLIMHLRYYIKRSHEKSQIDEDDNIKLYETIKQEEPEIYLGAKRVANYIDGQLQNASTKDEIFYLMIYLKRILNKEKIERKPENGK